MAPKDDTESDDAQLDNGSALDKYFRKMSCFRLLRELRERLTELRLLPPQSGALRKDDLRSLFFQLFDDMTVDCAYFVHALETSDAWPKNWSWNDKVLVFHALSEGHAEMTARQWRESVVNLLALRRADASTRVTTTLDVVVKDLARCVTYRQKTLRHLDFTQSGLVSAYELQLLPVRMYSQNHVKAAILKILMSYCDTHNVALVQCVPRRPSHLVNGFTASEGPWLLSFVIDASTYSNGDSMEKMVKTPAYCNALTDPQPRAGEESLEELPKPATIGLKKSALRAKSDRLSSSTVSTRVSSTYHAPSPVFGTGNRGLEPPEKEPPRAQRSAERLPRAPVSSPAPRAPRTTAKANLERIALSRSVNSSKQRRLSDTLGALSPKQQRTMFDVAALPLRQLTDAAPTFGSSTMAADKVVLDGVADVLGSPGATEGNAHNHEQALGVVSRTSDALTPSHMVEIPEVRTGQRGSLSSGDVTGAKEIREATAQDHAEQLRAYKQGVLEQSERDAAESLRAYKARALQSSIDGDSSLSVFSEDVGSEVSILQQVAGDVLFEQEDNERYENRDRCHGANLDVYHENARHTTWNAHDDGLQPEDVRPVASMRDEALRHYMINQQSKREYPEGDVDSDYKSPSQMSIEDTQTAGRDATQAMTVANVHTNGEHSGRDVGQNVHEDDDETSEEDEAYWMHSLRMAKMVKSRRT